MSKDKNYDELSDRISDVEADIEYIKSIKFIVNMLDNVKVISKMWESYPQMKTDLNDCYTFINAAREFIVSNGLKDEFNEYMNRNYGATLYRITSLADKLKNKKYMDDALPFN